MQQRQSRFSLRKELEYEICLNYGEAVKNISGMDEGQNSWGNDAQETKLLMYRADNRREKSDFQLLVGLM